MVGLEVHQTAQGAQALGLVVDELGVLLERRVAAASGGELELGDRERVEEVVFAVHPVLDAAAHAELLVVDRPPGRVRAVLAHLHLSSDDVDADAADPRGRPGEALVNEVLIEPHRLEDLGAVVALDRADPHLGDDLDNPLGYGLAVFLLGQLGRARDHPQPNLVVDGLERKVRVYCARAVAEQQSEVVNLARLPGFEDESDLRPRPGPDQVVVDRRDRQQGRDRGIVGVMAAIGQDDDVVAFGDRLRAAVAEFFDRFAEPGAAVGYGEEDRQGDRLEAMWVAGRKMADLLELFVREDRRGHLQLMGRLRFGLQEVSLRADRHLGGHDDLFADGVDRRVGDLGEELLEVGVEQLGPLGEHRQSGVVAHCADRLRASGGHRVDQDPDVLSGVAEDLLAAQHGFVVRLDDARRGRKLGQLDQPLANPLLVRVFRGDAVLEFVIGDDPLFGRVHEEHAARLQAALGHDLVGRNVEHAGLGGHHHAAVDGDVVAGRAQAVAVQRGADPDAVGEGDRRRSVPRLHEAGVVLVEGFLVWRHRLVVLPWFGDHHHQGMGQRAAREVQQLEGVVEDGRVGAIGVDGRQRLGKFVAEQLGAELRLTGVHPVDIAAQGVDLAVVGDVAVWMRPRPGRKGVGREARVDHGDGALDALVEQVRVEGSQLGGVEHPLEDDRPAAERGDVEVAAARNGRSRNGLLDQAADDVELSLERHVLDHPLRSVDEDLADQGLAGLGARAQSRIIGRDLAPTQEVKPLFLHDTLKETEAVDAADLVGREEDHPYAVAAPAAQPDAGFGGHLGQEAVGYLDGQAGAVAGVLLGAGGPAVLEIDQDGQGVANDSMGRAACDIHDESEAARIVLEGWVIKTLGSRSASLPHPVCHPRLGGLNPYGLAEAPTGAPAPCAGALYPLRKPECHRAGSRGQGCEGCDSERYGNVGPGAALRHSGRIRASGGWGARRAADRARLPTPPRRQSASRSATGESGSPTGSQTAFRRFRIVATDAPRPSGAGQSKDARPPGRRAPSRNGRRIRGRRSAARKPPAI